MNKTENIKFDYILDKVFGVEKNKELLISFINSILRNNLTVTDVEFGDNEASKILKDNQTVCLDIKAKVSNGRFAHIELNGCRTNDKGKLADRALMHLATMVSLDDEKRIYDYMVGIWIMGENCTHEEDAITEMMLGIKSADQDDYEIATDYLRGILIELPKFHPTSIDPKNMFDVWLTFLKNPFDDNIQNIVEIQKAVQALNEASGR